MAWTKLSACAALLTAAILSGCQGLPADYRPDPALMKASPAALRAKVISACVISTRARTSLSTSELQSKCGCYATRTFKAMSPEEVAFYRQNGYFSDSARAKGDTALQSCGIGR